MTHESSPDGHIALEDTDLVSEAPETPAPATAEDDTARRGHLEMPLPKHEQRQNEDMLSMVERVQQWDRDFKQSAQRGLREAFGYTTATVLDFECLLGRPGHDENDYELTVQVGARTDAKVGGEGGQIIKIIVRRAPGASLRS